MTSATRALCIAALLAGTYLTCEGTPLLAQGRARTAGMTVSGSGGETYVMLSGVVGGVAGFYRIERLLVDQGNRVIIIDPYELSLDSTIVSFDALARRVDATLAALGVSSAHVIGHAHGGGVALRLAANSSGRVSELILLDVGALAVNRTEVLSRSMRLIPYIAKLPMGRNFIRNRLISGLRENSVRTEWLNDETKHAYTESFLDNIDRVVSLAMLLSKAQEPEPLAAVIGRVTVPVTILLGQWRLPAGPTSDEILALKSLGTLLRIETIVGSGHFPHEESPDDVVRRIRNSTIVLSEATRTR